LRVPYTNTVSGKERAPDIILGSTPSVVMTIALLVALAGSLALMAFIVKKLEKAA
jgi:hypothetical protein